MSNIINPKNWERMKSESRCNKIFDADEKAIKAMRKPYKPSSWGRDMVKQIKRDTDSKGNYKPSGSFLKQLDRRGYLPTKEQIAKTEQKVKNYSTEEGNYA